MDLFQEGVRTYWDMFSVTFQDYKTYGFRVGENIAAHGEPSLDKCREAAKKAGILNKILSLPKQFETFLGREYNEDGAEFSTGEQQKLALARMIYKDATKGIKNKRGLKIGEE